MVALSSPHKDPRTGIYYIRRGVPAELKEQLGREHKRSLRTKDISEAKLRFAIALVECDQRFAEARLRLQSPDTIEPAYMPIKADIKSFDSIKQSIPAISSSCATASSDTEIFSIVYEGYKREIKPSTKLESEMDKAIRRFTQFHGEVAITTITRRQISAFKDALFKLPSRPKQAIRDMPVLDVIGLMEGDTSTARLKPASVKKDLSVIHAALEWAVDNGYRDDNPASRIRVRADRSAVEQRLPYSSDDLRIIFSSPVFAEGYRPVAGAEEAAYWLPLLALYTGARLDELGQLRVKDVRNQGGIWYIDINTNDKNKKLKTISSKRKVPLHASVLDKGFVDYVSALKESGMLFPALKADTRGKLTGNWSKWWGRYARQVGMNDERKVFHSFRHTFKDACREAGIAEEVHDALTGHAGKGTGRSYGSGILSLAICYQAIRKIKF